MGVQEFDVFDNVQSHTLMAEKQRSAVLVTELSPLQCKILKRLGQVADQYRR